jgi:hypothetical protein
MAVQVVRSLRAVAAACAMLPFAATPGLGAGDAAPPAAACRITHPVASVASSGDLAPVAKPGGPVRTFGGAGNSSDLFRSMTATEDGGYLLAGGMNFALWLLKVDDDWTEDWSRVYGPGTVWSVEPTDDGGFIAAGDTNLPGLSDQLWVQKLTAAGKIQFELTLGGPMRDYGYSVQQTTDGGFLVAGETQSSGAGGYDAWLVRLSSKGQVIWQRTYGGVADDNVRGVREAADGGFVAVGYTYLNGGFGNLWLFKVDESGDVVWELTYGGDDFFERGVDLRRTADGGFLVVGDWFAAAWILRVDSEGQPLWQEFLDDPHAITVVDSVEVTRDQGFLISGRTDVISDSVDSPNAWVAKITAKGKVKWQGALGFPFRFDRGYEAEELPDRSILVVGSTYSLGLGGDGLVWVLSRKGKSCGNLFSRVQLGKRAAQAAPVASHAMVGDSPFIPNKKKSKSQRKPVQGFVNCDV